MARESKNEREVSVRLYHEDTLETQNKFRNWIEILIKNEGIIPPQQRNVYFKQLSKSTFEIGRGQPIVFITKGRNRIPLGRFYKFCQTMAYQTKSPVRLRYMGKVYEVPIEDLWKTMLDKLLDIFPHALVEARRLSAERFRAQAKGDSVEFFPSTRTHRSDYD